MLFCRSCFCDRDFIVCEDATPEENNPPIECFVCGHVYSKTVREVDPVTGERLPPNLAISQTIDTETREAARAKLRADFMASTLRDGVRRENFTGLARRARGRTENG